MSIADLTVRIGANISEYNSKLNKVVADARKAGRDIEKDFRGLTTIGNSMSSVGQKLSIGVTLPLVAMGGAAVKAAASMESTKVAFGNILKSGAQAESFLKGLRDFAAKTPFEFDDLANASRKMLALGFSASEVLPSLTKIGDASSALGLGADGVNRVVLALGQMRLKGNASAEEMRQLVEAGVDAWGALAKALNTDVAGAMKMVEKRLIDGKRAAEIIMNEMGQTFAGGMEAQSKTMQGKWSNLMDGMKESAVSLGTEVTEALDLSSKLDSANAGLKWFNEMPKAVKTTTVEVGLLAAAMPLAVTLAGKFAGSIKEIVKWGRYVASSRLGQMMGSALSGPFGIALAYVVYKIGDIRTAWARLKSEWQNDRFLNEIQATLTGSRADTSSILTGKGLAPKAPDFAYTKSKPSPKAAPGSGSGSGEKSKLATIAEETASRFASAVSRAVSAVVDFREAGSAWGKKIETVQAKIGETLDVGQDFIHLLLGISDETRNVARANELVASGLGAIQAGVKPYQDLNDSIKALGITTDHELNRKLEQTADLYRKAGASGLYSGRDLIKIEYELLRAKEATGAISQAELERLGKLKTSVEGYGRSVADVTQTTGKLSKEISSVITNMNQSIADAIVNWKGFGDVAISTIKSIGKAIISDILTRFVLTEDRIKAVSDSIAGVFTNAKKAASLGKKAADVAASTVGAGTDAASGAAKALSSTSKIVSSSLMSTVSAVSGVVSAVSSVVGNFQMAGMNKSLDVIVKHTLETTNELRNLRADSWAREANLFRKLDDIWNTLIQGINVTGVSGNMAVAGGGPVNITLNYPQVWDSAWLDRLTDEMVRQMRLKGVLR